VASRNRTALVRRELRCARPFDDATVRLSPSVYGEKSLRTANALTSSGRLAYCRHAGRLVKHASQLKSTRQVTLFSLHYYLRTCFERAHPNPWLIDASCIETRPDLLQLKMSKAPDRTYNPLAIRPEIERMHLPLPKFVKLTVVPLTVFAFSFPACSQTGQSPEVTALVKKSLADMIFVKGGTFTMGDFGPQVTPEKLPFTSQQENKPAHSVTLDSFSISKYKVTYADLDIYTAATGKSSWPQDKADRQYRAADHPAGVPWQMAKDYCEWLGKQSGAPVDLPTEAQWEYAARSGGKPVIFGTNNGKYEADHNLPSADTVEQKYTPDTAVSQYVYPVGKYPPNALGLYDIGVDGRDWVNDWFAPDYYEHSPAKNPTGPANGTMKVIRGAEGDNSETAMTVYRYKAPPAGYVIKTKDGRTLGPTAVTLTFRCAVQKTSPL
jgi:sulfatase modifying factor 1